MRSSNRTRGRAVVAVEPRGGSRSTRWAQHVAGVAVVAVGASNAALGAWALYRDEPLRLSAGIAVALIAVGLVTVVGGVSIWRGGRLATMVWLTVFAILLAVQLADIADTGHMEPGEPGRLGVLLLLVVALGVAAVLGRRARAG